MYCPDRPFVATLVAAVLALPLLSCSASAPTRSVDEESYSVAGLSSSVEILVDRWGVAHIYAASQDDLFLAQGWNAARDRLWQLDLWKRRGDGTLAAVLGAEYLEKDRAARLFLYRGDMHAEWLAYADDTKRIVSSFVTGVNAYVDLTSSRPELLAPEFEVLGYRPAHWTPETVVKIRSHGLLRNVNSEVGRAQFLNRYGREALALRDVYEPEHELEVPEGLDLDSVTAEVLARYTLATGAVDFVFGEEEQASVAASEAWGSFARGSNNWAIGPGRTTTGRPILANDPHRSLAVPSLRYIVHLQAPGINVIGAGEPALPGVSIGHNERIAFGLTVFSIDQEDLYVYRTRPEHATDYWYGGRWERMTEVREQIEVKDGGSEEVALRFTRHGPVLWEDEERHLAYALRAAWLEPGMAPYLGSIQYMRADNWDQFLAAMNRWGLPGENQVYADVDGNIGWKPGGLAPVRPNWDGLLPVPGDGSYEWSGYYDMDQLPVESNPERGWVGSANQMNLPPAYSHQLGFEWAAPYRYSRIADTLEEARLVSVEDSLELQGDFLSLPAFELIRRLSGLEAGSGAQREALALLQNWDHRLEADSAAAGLFEVWLRRHLPSALWGRLAEERGWGGELVEALAQVGPRSLLRALDLDLLGADARDEVLLDSLEAAIAETEDLLGADRSRWQWGSLHHSRLEHPLSSLLRAELGAEADVGPLPRGGSGETVGATRYRGTDFRQTGGASFRMVVDVGAWDESVAMNSPGQSGRPESPHYRDLFPMWARDEAFPLLYSRFRVEQAAALRIRLEPR